MLNINEINFPITFRFPVDYAVKHITFESDKEPGIWSDGDKSGLSLSYFVKQHNAQNPYNEPHKPHYYEMTEQKREQDDQVDALQYLLSRGCELFIGDVKINNELIDDPVEAETETFCNIEDMPVGATILAIKRNAEGWDDVTFTPRRIEVHDDTITLLSGYSGFSKNSSYGLELNIKRGTKVKYRTNC